MFNEDAPAETPSPEPEAPKKFQWQYFNVTATWRQRDRKNLFVGKEIIKHLPKMPARDFMDAIRKAQSKFPGASVSLKMVPQKETKTG